MSEILDSGCRTQFASGAVRDIQEGKGRCDLLPLDVVYGVYKDLEHIIEPRYLVFDRINRFINDGDCKWLYNALLCGNPFDDIPTMLLEVAKHFEDGAKKYNENNWKLGINAKRYIDSGLRHYLKWLRKDKDEPHDRAFCWNIMCCIWTCINKPELNDYAPKEAK